MVAFKLYLIFSMLAIGWFDITRYIIPNWLVASLFFLYPLAVDLLPVPVDWRMALLGMAGIFAVGYAVFAFKWMGAGDIKLLTVCALWVGLKPLSEFIFLVALLGGAFAVIIWGLRKLLPYVLKKLPPLPRILREGEPMPYGVAIAAGFLIMMAEGKIAAIAF